MSAEGRIKQLEQEVESLRGMLATERFILNAKTDSLRKAELEVKRLLEQLNAVAGAYGRAWDKIEGK